MPIGGRDWRIIIGRGHSVEHAMLWCEEACVLIAGDQVLPQISPNISVWPQEPQAEPLGLYLESLRQLQNLPADVLVLPSHHAPFTGLHTRLDGLSDHHETRLAQAADACRQPRSAADVLRVLFRRPLDDHEQYFAIGETLSHLHHLEHRAVLSRGCGADGVVRFHTRVSRSPRD